MLNCFGFSSVKSILIKAVALQLDTLDAFNPVQCLHQFVRGGELAPQALLGQEPLRYLVEFRIGERRGDAGAGMQLGVDVEHGAAEGDVLAGNVLLPVAAAVVTAHHARVGGGPLGPVDPAVLDQDLLRGVVAGGQAGDE